MKNLKTLGMLAFMMIASVISAFAQQKPNVYSGRGRWGRSLLSTPYPK